jgi:hypothetical protein
LQGIPLAHLDEVVKVVKKSKPSGLHHATSTILIATARAGEAEAKTTLLAARVPMRTRALPLPTHFITTIMHAGREAKTTKTTTQLNRRCLAA